MSIFNTSKEFNIGDIYDIQKSLECNCAFVGPSNLFEHWSPDPKKYPEYTIYNELYDLCSVSQPDYTFYQVKPDKTLFPIPMGAFTIGTIKGFAQCSLGDINSFNEQLREKCSVSGVRVDIVHHFEISLDKGHPLSYEYMSNQFGLCKTKILLKFPTSYSKYVPEHDRTWVMMYTHKNDAPKRFWCVYFPLIPKQGYRDVFFDR